MKAVSSMRIWGAVLLVVLLSSLLHGQSNIEIKGLGFFGNLEMDRRLSFLNGVGPSEEEALRLVSVEDDAYILLQLLRKQGYRSPSLEAEVVFKVGDTQTYTWALPFQSQLEAGEDFLRPESVTFICRPGILQYYKSVEVEGLEVVEDDRIDDFFMPSGVLFTSRKDRAHTGESLDARISRLMAAVRNNGYAEVRLVSREIETDPDTGATDVRLVFEEGPLHQGGDVRLEDSAPAGMDLELPVEEVRGEAYNESLRREVRQAVLNQFYRSGYPDAEVRIEQEVHPPGEDGIVRVDLLLYISPGRKVTFGGVVFKPSGIMKPSVLERQTQLAGLSEYDLIAVEEGRRRLLSLGVFGKVDLEHEVLSPTERRAVYRLDPLPRRKLSLRLGYGSYEQLRVGALWEHRNLFGRAHRYELEVKRSFKSFNADGTYIIPHFFDKRITAYARVGHEYREEISFEQETSEAVLGASRKLALPGAEVSLEYGFERLDTTRGQEGTLEATDDASVSSISLQFVIDRRDSVLFPTRGFDAGVRIKSALGIFDSQTRFDKVEISGSYHRPLGGALYLHAGLTYGNILSRTPSSTYLPFGERFFPGGGNSVRGYRRGEASPLDTDGSLFGAETYLLGQVELEQRILRSVSLVAFWDGVGLNREQKTFPDEEFLYSVGLGLRFRTVVGPIRLEYGYNPEARAEDPSGTLHLSVGFPF